MHGYLSLDIICSEKLNSFPRASLLENCSLLGTDDVRGQISVHIFKKMEAIVYLCHAIENTANQNTGKPLHIRRYKPNLTIVRCDFIPTKLSTGNRIFCRMVKNSYATLWMVYHGYPTCHLYFVGIHTSLKYK